MGLKHVGIVLDGNRRFAKRLMKEPWKGHEFGAEKVAKLFEWCRELEIKEMTLYAFSMQNFNRPKHEFNYLMKLFREFFNNEKYMNDAHENKIKISFVGRINLFPEDIYARMKEIEEETKDYNDYKINFAMAYGGREEIIDGIKKLGRDIEDGKIDVKNLNEKDFEKFLYMDSEPDLIIRTGGDHRTSNFLAWQGVYAEWIFLEKTWPEFEKEDLINCLKNYSDRERRFGK
ncbi:MAG: polyprenyl diphosphate synthase [Candidatus Woesearchaeota archaeon]